MNFIKKILVLSAMIFCTNSAYSYTALYAGWQSFESAYTYEGTKINALSTGIIGTSPTRIYFYYNMLVNVLFSSGEVSGQLGWGLDVAAGIGYRFISATHKKSGWDLGMDISGYFTPYFLNSETSYTETALYYGVGLGINSVYKINPYIGMGLRAALKYNIGTEYLSGKHPSSPGILFSVGAFLTF